MKPRQFLIGLLLGLIILVIPFSHYSPLEQLQTLAVQLDGRKKPLDTVARETVAQIHGSTHNSFPTYLSLWLNDRDWNQEPFVLFNYRPLKTQVGLEPQQKYFSFQELIASNLGAVVLEARQKQAQDLELTRNEREALAIEDRLALLIATVGQNLPLVPHPTDIKGKWLGLDQAHQYYEPEQLAPLLAHYQAIKQTYQYQPEHLAMVGVDQFQEESTRP